MAEPITVELLRDVQTKLARAETAAQVREIFKAHYGQLGWKRLCRMFVLGVPPEKLVSDRDREERA
jgi:hypothetical protein